MYNISQFRPSLYLVIAIGFAGFGLALENIPLLLISLCALALSKQESVALPISRTLNAWQMNTGASSSMQWLIAYTRVY